MHNNMVDEGNSPLTTLRYTKIAMILHWILAIAFILMLISGWSMTGLDMPQSFKFNLFQWHKSLGVLVLLTVFVRIAWRLFHKPPVLPAIFSKFDVIASKLGHFGLYFVMIAMPLSGWAMVSSSKTGLPTFVFNLFQWPHIPGLAGNKVIHELAEDGHGVMAWVLLGLIVLHVGAVIKHVIFEKVNLLPRMLPACPRSSDGSSSSKSCCCAHKKD